MLFFLASQSIDNTKFNSPKSRAVITKLISISWISLFGVSFGIVHHRLLLYFCFFRRVSCLKSSNVVFFFMRDTKSNFKLKSQRNKKKKHFEFSSICVDLVVRKVLWMVWRKLTIYCSVSIFAVASLSPPSLSFARSLLHHLQLSFPFEKQLHRESEK